MERKVRIGIPREIKKDERRVGLSPNCVSELKSQGHDVFVERDAGVGAGFMNAEYISNGALIVDDAESLFDEAEMILKVKEPQPVELARLRPRHILFCYLHLAPDLEQTNGLLTSGATAIAYESVVGARGDLPLLTPMSQVAGRMAVLAGARYLESIVGGQGVLISGVPGVSPAHVVVIGGGVVGRNAVEMAVGLGATVTVLDRDTHTLRMLANRFGSTVRTIYSNQAHILEAVCTADLVIGAVLLRGAKAPHLITKDMLKKMRAGSVIVDVSIDQGGCVETSRPTTHSEPTYVVNDVIHYCVANMPGAVPRTSTQALNNATLPYVLKLAGKGLVEAMRSDPGLMAGLSVHDGRITEPAVAQAMGAEYYPPMEVLGIG